MQVPQRLSVVMEFMGSSAVVFQGTIDPVLLETYACREALSLAEDLDVQRHWWHPIARMSSLTLTMGQEVPMLLLYMKY